MNESKNKVMLPLLIGVGLIAVLVLLTRQAEAAPPTGGPLELTPSWD